MAYDSNLVSRVRDYLSFKPAYQLEEKKMFGGIAFMINGKMCVNVSNNQLMCRFDPKLTEQLSKRPGFSPMEMNGRRYTGYCYVDPVGYENEVDFEFWLGLCLDFNSKALISKKTSKK